MATQPELHYRLEEDVEKLIKFIHENFPGAHVELESYLTDTIPRILCAQIRLLREAGIGMETARICSHMKEPK